MVKSEGYGAGLPGWEHRLCWLTLDKWLNFSGLYFPHL